MALAQERIAKPQDLPALVVGRLAVEVREHAPLFAGARAKDEVHLAQTVVVARLVAHRQVLLLVDEPRLARRALEDDHRRQVRDGLQVERVGIADGDLTEARDDAQPRAALERPARDDRARPVLDEGDLGRAVAQQEAAARVERHAPEGDDRPVREQKRADG